MPEFVFIASITGTVGFIAARAVSKVSRTIVDNMVVWVFSLFLAILLCMVISLGWALENHIYGLISFAYVFIMDKSRMVRSFFER